MEVASPAACGLAFLFQSPGATCSPGVFLQLLFACGTLWSGLTRRLKSTYSCLLDRFVVLKMKNPNSGKKTRTPYSNGSQTVGRSPPLRTKTGPFPLSRERPTNWVQMVPQ